MKFICIYAGVPYYQQKLDYVFNIFKETLGELGVSITIVNLSQITLPYFEGRKNNTIQNIADSIQTSQAIIFATTAHRLSVSGAMQVFLEHIDYGIYGEILKNKPSICMVTSDDNSEYLAGNYLNTVLASLGLISSNNMLIGRDYLENIEMSSDIKHMIEKYAEDFYRLVKQNRKFFVATPFKSSMSNISNMSNINNNNNNSNSNNNNNNSSGLQISSYAGNNNQPQTTQKPQILDTSDFKTVNETSFFNANANINNNNSQSANNKLANKQVSDLYKKETQNNDFNYNNNLNNIAQNMVNNNNNNNFYENNNEQSLTDNNNYNSSDSSSYNYNNSSDSSSYNNNYNNSSDSSSYNNNSSDSNSYNNNYNNYNNSSDSSSYNNNNYNNNNAIPQITQNIQQQYHSEKGVEKGIIEQYLDNPDNTQVIPQNIDMPVHTNTLKQKTQSLYHYFQPQISQGLDISMQVMITGLESFNGYFIIKNSECIYMDGIHNDASVYIMSESDVWDEVLSGKCTLQKAFMLGRLKVKGNFVIISRFEQFFKII